MSELTARDISHITQQVYTEGMRARLWMIHTRPYICPFEVLVENIPDQASVLDIGCGDGLFLNVLAKLNIISAGIGFDTNQTAIQSANQATENLTSSNKPSFITWSVGDDWPEGLYDVVSMIDVLHHIPVSEKKQAVQQAMSHVKPNGLFLFKDIGFKPYWRRFFNSLHDLVLTGERVSYTPLEEVKSWAVDAGFTEIQQQTINRFWYGHELLILKNSD